MLKVSGPVVEESAVARTSTETESTALGRIAVAQWMLDWRQRWMVAQGGQIGRPQRSQVRARSRLAWFALTELQVLLVVGVSMSLLALQCLV